MNWSEMKILLTTMWYARMKCSELQESLPRIDELIKFVSANDNPQCNWLLKVEPSCVYGEMHGTEQDEWINWIHHSHKQLLIHHLTQNKCTHICFSTFYLITMAITFFASYMSEGTSLLSREDSERAQRRAKNSAKKAKDGSRMVSLKSQRALAKIKTYFRGNR